MLPGPTNVPNRVMRAMLAPIINHRSDDFVELYTDVVEKTHNKVKKTHNKSLKKHTQYDYNAHKGTIIYFLVHFHIFQDIF